jgi:hypothetical protein
MLVRVNAAKSMRDIDKTLDYMDKVMNKQKDKEEGVAWSKEFEKMEKQLSPETYAEKGAKPLKGKTNVTTELLGTLNELKSNLFNKTREEGQRLATELVENIPEERYMTAEELDKLEEYSQTYGILSSPHVWESTSEELKNVNEYIKARIKGEKTQAWQQRMAEQATERDVHSHFGDIIRGKQPKVKSYYDKKHTLKTKTKRGIIDFVFKNANIFTINNFLSQESYKTDPVAHIYGSEMERYWIDKIHDADNTLNDGIREITTKANEAFKKIFGKNKKGVGLKRHLLLRAYDLKNKIVEVKYKAITGEEKTTNFTQEELGSMYMYLRNEDLWENLSKIDPKEPMGGMIKYNPETGTLEKTDLANQIDKSLDDDMRQWAEFIGEMLDGELYNKYNPTYKKFFAFDMPKTKMYFPLHRITKENANMGVEELLESQPISAMGYNRHLYKRTGSTDPIKIMPISDVFYSYIDKMERFHARAEVLQEMKRFYNNPDIKEAIIQRSGKRDTMQAINQFLDRYAGLKTGSIVKSVDKIRRMVTRASLGLKPVIMVKQVMSFPAYSAFLPPGQLVKGMAKFWTNPVKNWKKLSEASYILNRYNAGFDRDIADAMVKDYKSKKQPLVDSFMNKTMFMVKWGDRLPIILGGYAVYDYNYNKFKKEGQGHEEAHKNAIHEFELATRFTQQASCISKNGIIGSENGCQRV